MSTSIDLSTLTDSELLRVVDRSNPEVRELAQRLDTVLNQREQIKHEIRALIKKYATET